MMEIFNWLNNALLAISDPFLSWLLNLPRDVALVIIAVATSFIMTIVRKWSTNQDLLKRCDDDKKRLKVLIKTAKENKDKEAIKRYRSSLGMIGGKCMMAEFKPLIWVIIPIAILGTWAFNRMGFFAPKAGENIQITGYFPVADCGDLVFLMPEEGIEVVSSEKDSKLTEPSSWIKEIKLQELTKEQKEARLKPDGVANWNIKAKAADKPYKLKIRHNDKTYEMDYLVGEKKYSMNFNVFSDTEMVPSAEIKLREYKPFDIVPGIESMMCPPWLVGYMIIAVLMVFVMKPALKIH
ncbi:MAG: hypothetical protein COA79_16015 [Planctomycetota bacterium]|nr:MAG: hypothetical protein COA79_16015 [Planctomycetota bacterium]